MSSLRAIGNTRVPLLFVMLGTGLNALLDPLLILGVGPFPRLGLDGAAVASLVASAVATGSGLVYLKRQYGNSPMFPRRFSLDRALVARIATIGFPSFVQQSLFSFAIAFLTTLVNGFGATATAAFGITGRIDTLVALPAMAVLAAVSTVTAQSLGAGKPERIHEVFKWGLAIDTPVILIITLICVVMPTGVMRLFVNDPAVVAVGVGYLRIVGGCYLFLIPPFVSNGIIIGSGRTLVTMLISFVNLCVVRLPLAAWLSHTRLGLTGVWVASAMTMPLHATLSYLYYRSGRWKTPIALAGREAALPAAPHAAPPAER